MSITTYSTVSNALTTEGETTINVSETTKFSELGITSGEIGISKFDNTLGDYVKIGTISITSTMTLGEFINESEAYGVSVTLISDSTGSYLKVDEDVTTACFYGFSGGIANLLYDTVERAEGIYSLPTVENYATTTVKATDSTELSTLGVTTGEFRIKKRTDAGGYEYTTLTITSTMTVGDLRNTLNSHGITSILGSDGVLTLNSNDSCIESTGGSNIVDLLFKSPETSYSYSGEIYSTTMLTSTTAAELTTKLSDLGVTAGEYYVYQNGVKNILTISNGDTVGSFINQLKSFGLDATLVTNGNHSNIQINANANSYVTKSDSANASNITDILFNGEHTTSYAYTGIEQISTITATNTTVSENTIISELNNAWGENAAGKLVVNVNGQKHTINIAETDTIGDFLGKFSSLGIEATIADGQILLQSGFNEFSIDTANSTSSFANPSAKTGLIYNANLGGYSASIDTVLAETTAVIDSDVSAANWADLSTKLSLLDIKAGTFSLYKNGKKADIQIDDEDTFKDLNDKISAEFKDVSLSFENGYLRISSNEGAKIMIGAHTDTSNFMSITGIYTTQEGDAQSTRELYRVNTSSRLTESGLFRKGNVTEGTFIIGDATFTIDSSTTLQNLISQINTSDKSNATAYWDSITGNFVLKSRTTGAALINIEAGDSNFTDILGFTSTVKEGDIIKKKLETSAQEVGENARFKINDTTYTSNSNIITSDISRIQGLTINLKGLTNGSTVQIKVEKNRETIANAMDEVVSAYNELMENVDEAIAIDGQLHDQTILKLLRNRLRTIMTSSGNNSGLFKNLDSIGISVSAASANNISTSNKSVVALSFNREKFIDAFNTDSNAVKTLLIGNELTKGVFIDAEELVENALQGVIGYFDSTNSAYTNEVMQIENKITKANAYVERYKAQLEKKFSAMDRIIAAMQQQYSSFLTGSSSFF